MEKESKKKSNKRKLPFAVFVNEKSDEELQDYKQVFTDIISDRIHDGFKS